jgi:hypothetical protein
MVAAESDEMTLPAVVKTRESPWHEDNLVCSLAQVCDVWTSPLKPKPGLSRPFVQFAENGEASRLSRVL